MLLENAVIPTFQKFKFVESQKIKITVPIN